MSNWQRKLAFRLFSGSSLVVIVCRYFNFQNLFQNNAILMKTNYTKLIVSPINYQYRDIRQRRFNRLLIFECVVDIFITLRIHNSIMSRKKSFLPSIRRLFTSITVNRTSLYAYLKWKDCILRWPIPFIMLDSEYMVQITSGLIQSN